MAGRDLGGVLLPGWRALIVRRGEFSRTSLDRGGEGRDLVELNGWSSAQMLRRYGASACAARARRTYDRIMEDGR